jgi:hypothetical protein
MFSVNAIELENPKYYETVKKTIDQMNRDGKIDEVQRAYYCRFVRGEKSFFNQDKVFGMFDKSYSMLNSYIQECDMGVDFGGKVSSKTVITISTLTKDNRKMRLYHKSYPVDGDESLLDDISELLKKFNIQRIIPDECPQGAYLIREMVNRGWNVHPMNFRSDKVKKYGAFRAALNREEVVSYEDSDLKTEMVALEQSEGNRQSNIMHAPGYNDDLIDAFVMSCYFYVEEEDSFQYYDLNDYGDNGEENEDEENTF